MSNYVQLAGHARQHGYNTCTVVSGATKSSVIDLYGFTNYGLMIPTISEGTVTFEASNLEDGTFYVVTDKGASTALTIASSTGGFAVESDDLAPLAGYRYVKVVTGVTQSGIADVDFVWTLKA